MSEEKKSCQITTSESSSVITLATKVKVAQAAEFKSILIAALQEKKPIRVDMSDLNELDVSIIQLLYAAKNKAKDNDIDFDIFPLSESVKDTLRSSGTLHEFI